MNRLFATSFAAALATIGAASPPFARLECYDFSGLVVGTEYETGQTVNATRANIEFRPYQLGGSSTGELASGATVQQAQIAGGAITSFSIGGHTWRLDDMCIDR